MNEYNIFKKKFEQLEPFFLEEWTRYRVKLMRYYYLENGKQIAKDLEEELFNNARKNGFSQKENSTYTNLLLGNLSIKNPMLKSGLRTLNKFAVAYKLLPCNNPEIDSQILWAKKIKYIIRHEQNDFSNEFNIDTPIDNISKEILDKLSTYDNKFSINFLNRLSQYATLFEQLKEQPIIQIVYDREQIKEVQLNTKTSADHNEVNLNFYMSLYYMFKELSLIPIVNTTGDINLVSKGCNYPTHEMELLPGHYQTPYIQTIQFKPNVEPYSKQPIMFEGHYHKILNSNVKYEVEKNLFGNSGLDGYIELLRMDYNEL